MRTDLVRRRVAWIVTLAATWVLLNGDLTTANVVGGALVAVGVVVLVPLSPTAQRHRVHPVALVRFALFVLGSLVTSSWAVVRAALRPTDARLRAGIVRVPLPGATPLVTALVANAITLTPGTLTVTADDGDAPQLHVHVLGLGDPDDFRARVRDLQARATAAFTPVPMVEGR